MNTKQIIVEVKDGEATIVKFENLTQGELAKIFSLLMTKFKDQETPLP